MARGWTLSDIGDRLTWADLRDFIAHLPPDGTSAYYRAVYPKTWWWRPEFDFHARIVHALEVANWQRADPNRRGEYPKPIERPKQKRRDVSPAELEQRKAKLRR